MRIEFRIGVNLGDVIVEGDDIYGDGVNVAARLKALPSRAASPFRSPCAITSAIVLILFEDRGEQQLKNIERPIRVYDVVLDEPGNREAEPD